MLKIINWNKLDVNDKKLVLSRPIMENKNKVVTTTKAIIEDIKKRGNSKLREYSKIFDKIEVTTFKISKAEIDEAYQQVCDTKTIAIKTAIKRVRNYHQGQIPENNRKDDGIGIICERQSRPIQRVGLYVPGGSAPLISTVMMLAIPAEIAACPSRVLCTPPQADGTINPYILVTADLCGIQQIYKAGGAQAIAAMAYGTETIPKVDKIFGPGNAWVTAAKILCAEDPEGASLDMPAGPSEVLVIADATANPEFIAADLLSQAEHDANSQVMLLTLSEQLANKVKQCVNKQLMKLSRRKIAQQSLQSSGIIIVESVEKAIEISNQYAPEHLILQLKNPEQYVNKIQAAGTVFLGPWAPETLGDYVTGCNHVLPTYGYARSYSGLSVNDFVTTINFQSISKNGLKTVGPMAEDLADLEGLTAHKNAVSIRLKFLEAENA